MLKILLLIALSACTTVKAEQDIQVVEVYDGDTIKVDFIGVLPIFGENLSIRLYGIDTPEIRTLDACEKKKGYEARAFLINEITNATNIDIVNCIRGKYFRLICDVILDGVNVAHKLIREGYAVEYYGGTRQKTNWCKEVLL